MKLPKIQIPRLCPMCGSDRSNELFSTEKRGVHLRYQQCINCLIVFRDYFDPVDEEFLYDYQTAWSRLTREEAFPSINAERYFVLLKQLATQSPGRSLLDVGCGKGHFVYRAQEAGWASLGIEKTSTAIQAGERFGAPVLLLDFLTIENRVYDVITMFELVEHLAAPATYISKAAELLATGGLLYLTTPNVRSFDAWAAGSAWRAFDPEHLVLFSPEQLVKLVRTKGFEVVSVSTRNLSPSLVKQVLLGRRVPKIQHSSPGKIVDTGRESDQLFRRKLRRSRLMGHILDLVNVIVGRTGLGSTIVLLARKTQERSDP